MTQPLQSLALPALACAVLVGIHSFFGLHVLKRGRIFVDLAIALVAAAAAPVLVELAPEGAEHIRRVFTGDVLTVTGAGLAAATVLYAVVGLSYAWVSRRLEGWRAELAFYAALAVVVTSSAAIAGIPLVFAFLVIPAAIGMLHAVRFDNQLAIAWIVGTLAGLAGLAVSYASGYSAVATLLCAFAAALAIAGIAHGMRLPQARGAKVDVALRLTRWMIAALLAASGIWIAVAPRADQPVLDALERAFPAIRTAYMDEETREVLVKATAAGQQAVAAEVRRRARESMRLWIAGAFLLLAGSIVVSLPRRAVPMRS